MSLDDDFKLEYDFGNVWAINMPILTKFWRISSKQSRRSGGESKKHTMKGDIAFLAYAFSETILRVINVELLLDALTTIQHQAAHKGTIMWC